MSKKRRQSPYHTAPAVADVMRARRQSLLSGHKPPQDLAALVSRDVGLFAEAQVLEERHEFGEAMRLYQAILDRHGKNRLGTEALWGLLRVHITLGRLKRERFPRSQAVRWAQEYVRRRPDDSYGRCTLGMLYSSVGEMAAALSEAAVATKLDLERVRPWRSWLPLIKPWRAGACEAELGDGNLATGCLATRGHAGS